MTDIHCDAIKIAYRQSKDGFVVSFAIHPSDMPAVLANADIGSQWRLVLSELDENGNGPRPLERFAGDDIASDRVEIPLSGGTCNAGTGSAGVAGSNPARSTKKSWHEMPMSQQAGIRCAEVAFHQFLKEHYHQWRRPEDDGQSDIEKATAMVRLICQVQSRTQIKPGTEAAELWARLDLKYRTWQLAAQVVPA